MKLVLVGGGGHATACIDVIAAAGRSIEGVVDPNPASSAGLRWLGDDSWLERPEAAGNEYLVTVGQVGSASRRAALHARLKSLGLRLATVVSPHAVVSRDAEVGEGTIVMHRAVLNAQARVGANCIINTGALVEHHATVGDHVHVATGAIVNGAAAIGSACLVGSGCIVLHGVRVASGTLLGAGAVVTRNIDQPGTWTGVPARSRT